MGHKYMCSTNVGTSLELPLAGEPLQALARLLVQVGRPAKELLAPLRVGVLLAVAEA